MVVGRGELLCLRWAAATVGDTTQRRAGKRCSEAHLCAGKMVRGGEEREKGLGAGLGTRTRANTSRCSEDWSPDGTGTVDGGRMGNCEASPGVGARLRDWCAAFDACTMYGHGDACTMVHTS